MKLYFSPLACSLATRIVLDECGASDVELVEVDGKTKTTSDGRDYRAIHALGLVPLLELDDGTRIAENPAILQWVADRFAAAQLAPRDALGRALLQQWLGFVGAELHKAVFVPLLDETAAPEVKAYALAKAPARLDWLAAHLEGRDTLLERFTVADAYLFAILNWAAVTPIDLQAWPAIARYHRGLGARPSVARAFARERDLWFAELGRHGRLETVKAALEARGVAL